MVRATAVALMALFAVACSAPRKAEKSLAEAPQAAPAGEVESMEEGAAMDPEAKTSTLDEAMPAPTRAPAASRRAARKKRGVTSDVLAPMVTCPLPRTDEATIECSGAPSSMRYGVSLEEPLEWGPDASQGELFFGRLACADGAVPELGARRKVDPPALRSSSPLVREELESMERVTVIEVTCPGQPSVDLFVNGFRCGSMCPPSFMTLVPAKTFDALVSSRAAWERGATAEALALATLARDSSPGFEVVHAWIAGIQRERKQWDGALASFEAAAAINPDEPGYALGRVDALLRLGRHDEAEAISAELLSRLPEEDPSRLGASCLRAEASVKAGRDGAQELARQACDAGAKRCCRLLEEPGS